MTDTPTAKRVEVTETGRVYVDRKPLPFKTGAVTVSTKPTGKDTTVTVTIPVDGEVCLGGLDDLPTPHAARGTVAIMALDFEDARATAKALGVETWAPFTIANAVADMGKAEGLIVRDAIASPRFTFRAAQGDGYAYDVAARILRALATTGARA